MKSYSWARNLKETEEGEERLYKLERKKWAVGKRIYFGAEWAWLFQHISQVQKQK